MSGPDLFVGAVEKGVFISRDNGASWIQVNAGLPQKAEILCLAASDTDLFAGTEDGKVWRLPLSEDSLIKAQSSDPYHPETSAVEDEIALFKQVLSLLPDNAETWEKLGESYVKIGNDKEALAAFKKVVKLKPNNAEAWYALGGCYEKAGRKEDADKAFERARTLKPELFKK
jgi:cytochrome c-type biogenesis protein CcmH/NrfG